MPLIMLGFCAIPTTSTLVWGESPDLGNMVTLHLVPKDLSDTYEVHEWRNAAGVLSTAHPSEWQDIIEALRVFEFRRSEILAGGKNKSVIASRIDAFLTTRGWQEKKFETKIRVDAEERDSPTHKVDCFKGRVGLEIDDQQEGKSVVGRCSLLDARPRY